MQAQFEDIFKQMSVEAAGSEASAPPAADAPGGGTPAKSSDAPAGDESFQETIRRTMERMQNSGEQATAAAASGNEEDFMAEMLKQLSSGDFGGGEGGEEEFSKMLMGMMEQLTNKEILYEPMKELNDKFPEWLDKNRATTSAEDLKRYEEQKGLVAEIVAKFEGSSYSDSNRADREYIVDRMQKVRRQALALCADLLLTSDRCKRLARLRPTWWGTWHRRRRHSTDRTTSVIRSRIEAPVSDLFASIYTRPVTRPETIRTDAYKDVHSM